MPSWHPEGVVTMTAPNRNYEVTNSHSFLENPFLCLGNLKLVKHSFFFLIGSLLTLVPLSYCSLLALVPLFYCSLLALVPFLFLLHLCNFSQSSYSSALRRMQAAVPPQWCYSPAELYSITSQKTAVLTRTAVTI